MKVNKDKEEIARLNKIIDELTREILKLELALVVAKREMDF